MAFWIEELELASFKIAIKSTSARNGNKYYYGLIVGTILEILAGEDISKQNRV